MTHDEARLCLLMHGPGTEDADGQPLILRDGFTASLRPYTGLHEKNFHQVMEALLTVGERLHKEELVDRETVRAVWMICETGRGWGLHPQGMLQRNKLITAADTLRLELWIDTIQSTALRLLGGWPPHWAVYNYARYVAAVGVWDNVDYFVELMNQAVADSEVTDSIETLADALGKSGGRAKPALPNLRQALLREYTWYTPTERCTEEVRGHIRKAIEAIECADNVSDGS